jgi:hypothetical protein
MCAGLVPSKGDQKVNAPKEAHVHSSPSRVFHSQPGPRSARLPPHKTHPTSGMRHPKAQAAALLQSNLPFVKEKEKKIPSARTPPHATSAGPVLVLPDSPSPSSTRQFPPARLAGVLSVRGQPPLRRRPLRHPHPHPGVLCCLFNTQSKSYLNRDGLFSPVGAPPQIRPRHPHTAPAPNPSLAAAAMVYVDSWDEFVERSVQLFRADPSAVRRRYPDLLPFIP